MHLGKEAMGTQGMPVYAMPRMLEFLSGNGPWSQLVSLGNIDLQRLEHDTPIRMGKLSITPFLVPHRDEYSETVGYRIEGPNRTALFIPDINKWEDWEVSIVEALEAVNYALIDASFLPMVNLVIAICLRSHIHSCQRPWRCSSKAAQRYAIKSGLYI